MNGKLRDRVDVDAGMDDDALAAPRVGRLIDRTGARTIMASGSVLYAVSLAALSFAQGMISYLACWALMGIASTLALNTPSSIALAQIAGPAARRAIAVLAILVAWRGETEHHLQRQAQTDALTGLANRTALEERASLALAYYDGLSHAEVADEMAQPLGTIKSWIRRGLQSLRDCLDRAARGTPPPSGVK